MATESNESLNVPTGKSPKRRAAIGALILVIYIVVLIGARIAMMLPLLNYYHYRDASKWTRDSYGRLDTLEPLNTISEPPGYCFKNGDNTLKYYPPASTWRDALWYALVNSPDEIVCGWYDFDWSNPESHFIDPKGQRIPRPSDSEMPLFVFRPHFFVKWSCKGHRSPRAIEHDMPHWGEYQRLTNAAPYEVISREASLKLPPTDSIDIGVSTECVWTERSEPNSFSAYANFAECWVDSHSTYYSKSGIRETKPSIAPGWSDYYMIPHLTLLYDKHTDKLAGGYWWGEFHNIFDRRADCPIASAMSCLDGVFKGLSSCLYTPVALAPYPPKHRSKHRDGRARSRCS